MLELARAYHPDGSATWGLLNACGRKFPTLEPPWEMNVNGVSCIPEGSYTLRLRASPIVQRTSRGEFSEGWEVRDVPGRTFIMLHVGNWVQDTDGCLLIGSHYAWDKHRGAMVGNSLRAFRELMHVLSEKDEWHLDIRCKNPECP